MKYELKGTVMPVLKVEMSKDDSIYAEAGALLYMTEGITMESKMKGGLFGGLGRMVTGESLMLVYYEGSGTVAFNPSSAGEILKVELGNGKEYICQKDAFLVAETSVNLAVTFTKKFGAGLLGGEGFILEKLSGNGLAFLEIDGEVVELSLKEGESIKVDTGAIGFFESTVSYNVEMVKGIKNMLFGGEGFFLAKLTGPGKVWLQSLPLQGLAGALKRYLPGK